MDVMDEEKVGDVFDDILVENGYSYFNVKHEIEAGIRTFLQRLDRDLTVGAVIEAINR